MISGAAAIILPLARAPASTPLVRAERGDAPNGSLRRPAGLPAEAVMGLLGFLGLGGRGDRHLVVVTFEGPGRLRLNGNRTSGKRAKQGAAAHDQTVGWIEFDPGGGRVDQGLGPAAARLGADEAAALLRDLPQDPACQAVLRGLAGGRDHSSKVLSFEKWGRFGVGGGPAAPPAE